MQEIPKLHWYKQPKWLAIMALIILYVFALIPHSILYICDKLWPAILTIPVAVLVTQHLAQILVEERKPRLKLVPEGVYFGRWGPIDASGNILTYHSWRIIVQHTEIPSTEIPKFLGWFIKRRVKSREPAYNCKAQLTFYDSNGVEKFKMHGRWANTPEPTLSGFVIFPAPSELGKRYGDDLFPLRAIPQGKIMYADTVDIGFHDDEPTILDCINKFDDEALTYAWNNESYAFIGNKTPGRDLKAGVYTVDVKISSPSIKPFTKKFKIVTSEEWQEISLTPA